ncbi:MAG: hypothetical protein ACRCUS_08310 [Anaerovoracaceae bacterium]
MLTRWTVAKRKELELYISKKITIEKVAEILEFSRESVYKELRLGLEKEDGKKFERYSAAKAQKRYEEKLLKKARGE